jgi:hypothetical protein
MPSCPRYRLRLSPCRRLSTLIRPSQPVLHVCPLRNQRCFWCFRRAALWVETIGDRDPPHARRVRLPFIFRRVRPGIAG